MNTKLSALIVACATAGFLTVSSAFAIPYCSSTESVNCAKYGIGGKDCHQLDDAPRGQECVDVSSKGMKIIRDYGHDNEERCPSGYQESEDKCSVQERRNGCKDMRLPGGLGCVRR